MNEHAPIKLHITRTVEHAPHLRSFFMLPHGAAKPHFTAGQVAVLAVNGLKPSYFAFASAPDEDEFEFLIKRGGNGTDALFEAPDSARIELQEIVGRGFPVEEFKGHDLVFVGMGTGLAPLRSALRHVFKTRGDYGRLVVLYGARTPDDFCFEDEMTTAWRAHGVELRQVLSQPDSDWSGPTGYVQSLLDHLVPDLRQPLALVCGSVEMMTQTQERLLALGFAAEKILTNY